MRYVKIGDSYFNPLRIDRIKAEVDPIAKKFRPAVQVVCPGGMYYFSGIDLGMSVPDCEERYVALGIADAMVDKVVASVNEALK